MRVVDPSGTEPVSPVMAASTRPPDLRGRRLAVLDNGKPNAGYVVRWLGERIAGRSAAQPPVAAGKALASRPAPDEVLTGFRGFDAAIVGVGD